LQTPKSQVRVLATSRNSLGPTLKSQRILPASVNMALTQRRSHAGHSHSHSHHHDNAYLTSTNKKDAGVRITRLGLFVNLGMAIGKGVGGYVFHSQALIADAFHALTDLVSDFMTLASKMNGAG
jgi:Cation efflux family